MFNLSLSNWKERRNFLKSWEFRNMTDVNGFIVGGEFTNLMVLNSIFILNEEHVINKLERTGFTRVEVLPQDISWSDLLGPGFSSELYNQIFYNTNLNIVLYLIDVKDWDILITTKEITSIINLSPELAIMLFTKTFKILKQC